MEAPREFIRRRKIEQSKDGFHKRLAEKVNIDKEVSRLEEYVELIKNPPTPEPFVCLEEKFCSLISCRKQCNKCRVYEEGKR